MQVRFLGTACAIPTPSRFNASIAVSISDAIYLLDCGEPCAHSLVRAGYDLSHVRAAFITHAHSDHLTGLPTLIEAVAKHRRAEPLQVFVPSRSREGLEAYLRLIGTPWPLKPYTASQVYADDRLQLHAAPTRHLAESYAFSVEAEGRRFVYSGDVKGPDDVAELCNGADLVALELAHFPPEAIGDALQGRSIGRLVITHLSHRLQGVESERRLAALLTEELAPTPVQIGHDGMVVTV